MNTTRRKQGETLLDSQKRVLEMIAAGLPLSETLDALLRIIEAQSDGMLCSILLLDTDGIHVRHGAAPSLPESYIKAIDGKPIGPRAGSCGTAAFRGEQVIVKDIMTDPLWEDYRDLAAEHELRACWSTPVFDTQRHVLGTFAVYSHRPARPTKRHLQLIEMATHTAAIAIGKHHKEGELRESEERYRIVNLATNDAVWDWNLVTDELWWNDGIITLFGYSQKAVGPDINWWCEHLHPQDRDRVVMGIHAIIDGTEHAWTDEYRYLRADGSYANVFDRGYVMRDASEKPVRMIGAMQDITERTLAEERTQKSESLKDAIIKSALDCFVTIDHEGKFIEFNPAAEVTFGYTRAEVLGKSMTEFIIPPHLRGEHNRGLAHYLATGVGPILGQRIEQTAIRADGTEFPIELTITPVRHQSTLFFTGYIRDITERKRAETALRENEERARLESLLRDLLLSKPGDEMYADVLNLLLKQFDSRFGFFGYIREEDGALVCPSMTRDIWEVCAVEGKSVEFPRASWGGLWGRILIEHQSLLKNELHKTPKGHVPLYRSMGAPLLVDGELIGSIHLANRATDYTAGDLELLTHLCSIIAPPLKLRLHRDKSETERNQANEALQESARKYRELVENANSIILRWGCDGRITFINEFGQQFFGYTEAELLGQHVVGTLVPETESTGRDLRPLMEQICANPKMFEHNINENMRRTGERAWIAWTNKTIFDERGLVKEVLSIGSDITERKQAEESLTKSQRNMLRAQAIAHLGNWEWNPRQNYLTGSEELFRIFGIEYTQGKCPLEIFLDRIHPDDRDTVNQAMEAILTGARNDINLEYRIVLPDGTIYSAVVQGEGIYNEQHKLTHIFGIIQDVTDQKQAAQKIAQAEARYRHLLNSSPSAIYATTLESRKCTYISETMIRLTGYTPQAMLDDPGFWFDHVHPDDIERTKLEMKRQLEIGKGQLEYRFRKKNGEYLWIRDNFRVIWDAKGQPFEVVGSWTDITASRRLEEQLTQSQKMEAVGQLTGGIAHDFNNRLTVIMGNLELLQRKSGMSPVEIDLIKGALLSADGAADLTRQLLTFSRQHVLETAVININDLITGMHNMLQRTLGETVNVVVSPAPNLWPVKTDRALLENVLLNLAVNARDAMPKGGKLTIETSNQVLEDTFSESHGREIQGDFVLLAVSDTGQGMSEEIKRRVFEPFFTTKDKGKGTGLGLAMVYGFVKQSAGHIEIYSEPGHGTSFKIYLPKNVSTAVVDAPSPPPATAAEEAAVFHNKVILLAEDEAEVRNMVVTLLGNLGCRVLSADSGPAALEIFAKTPGIDLLFTDIIMPGGMTGLELAAKIRERAPELKVLYTSGYAPQAAADRRTIEHPNDFWLAKPYRFKTLKNMIIKVFGA